MSNFICSACGTLIIDSPGGYLTGCEHYPKEEPEFAPWIQETIMRMNEATGKILQENLNKAIVKAMTTPTEKQEGTPSLSEEEIEELFEDLGERERI